MTISRAKISKRRAFFTLIPLLLVNIVAFGGQFGYIQEHIAWFLAAQIVFALALESVALFLAYMANQALMSEDTALGLRLASYAFGFIIGFMNYSHYAGVGLSPTFEAVATGLMSVASPWLWGIYSRRQHRDRLYAKRLLTPRAVKLGFLRWAMWPGRSWRVFRLAAWAGENRPEEALAAYEVLEGIRAEVAQRAIEAAEAEAEAAAILPPLTGTAALTMAQSKAEAVRIALAEFGDTVAAGVVATWLSENGWEVNPDYVRVAKSRAAKALSHG
jgi:hypothetical protein